MQSGSGSVNRSESTGDGRRARWTAHREQRRLALIGAAVEALVQHGPDVDMDQVAAAAGISKPVLYRYFADKAQLWLAVGEHMAQQVLEAVVPTVAQLREEPGLIAATVDAYLAAIETQPELYRFLRHQAGLTGVEQLMARSTQIVAVGLARAIGDRLRALGLDAGPAEPWAFGLVGFVQAVGDWWMVRGQPMSRAALTEYLTTLLWKGFEGVQRAADLPGGLRFAEAEHD
jgi:AcrR family transcriptional regulator